ncbi:DNA-binding protein, partial [Bacteroides thetaiotaomicron]|nr:DNA-binding protein [Bacteroides thetaiotaomicron]MBG9238019.1 DNA-binding protein [Bacteroides thetaiotaomicron]MCE8502552.1 DNA-binding protein [Bacteroides thetaiotaomicron]MCE8502592.1 DNA-binding protein [Bacteroides thetaiotaomicron]
NLKLDSQLKQQAEYQKPTTPGGGGSGSGNTPDPKPNPDEGDEEAPDPTV